MTKERSYMDGILEILPHVEKPSRYLPPLKNARHKDLSNAAVTWALTFPDAAESGHPHHGLEILYDVLNRDERFAAERAFLPWMDMEKELRSRGIPITSNESQTPLGRFDVIGMTLQYELSYTNVLAAIDLAGLELRAENREDIFPLIGGGGPCATNPEPMAPFLDFFLIGEGEEAVTEISETILRFKKSGDGNKRVLLRALSEIDGVYVPSLYTLQYGDAGRLISVEGPAIRRRIVSDLSRAPIPTAPVVSAVEPIHDRVYSEIARGCGVGCRFCQAGYIYRPLRERPYQEIVAGAVQSLRATGHDNVTLASLSSGDHAEILPILRSMNGKLSDSQIGLSLPSLRACTLTNEVINEVKGHRKSSFTIAPEAGSDRMLRLINKGITRDHVLDVAERTVSQGWELLKLYFLIGLPTEEDEDVDGIASLSNEVFRIGQSIAKRGFRLNVSVSNLVPKPHTPFQWEAHNSIEEVKRKQSRIARALMDRRIALKCHNAYQTSIEDVLSRGDRRIADVIEAAYNDGSRFDEWKELFSYRRWTDAIMKSGINVDDCHRERGEDELLPWQHIDVQITKKFLLRERHRARVERNTPFCRKECRVCRSCDDETFVIRNLENEPGGLSENGSVETANEFDRLKPPEGTHRVRFRFTKEGTSRFFSQLELLRLFKMALKRSELPIGYSQGYSPHMKISFGRPLPVGYAGQEELIEFVFSRAVNPEEAAARLNEEMPDGVRIKGGEDVLLHGPSLDNLPMEIEWVVEIPSGIEIRSAREWKEEFVREEKILVDVFRKKRRQVVDVKCGVRDIVPEPGARRFTIRTSVEGNIRRILIHFAGGDEKIARSLYVCRRAIVLPVPDGPAVDRPATLV